MLNIIRIIPKMKFGGVECGLLNEIKILNSHPGIKYHIFILEKSDIKLPASDNVSVVYLDKKITNFYSAAGVIKRYISINKLDNVVILSSLWKSHLISFFLYKYYRVSFFHSSSYSHVLDFIFSKLAFSLHDKSIYDSYTTRELYSQSGYIVPYVFKQSFDVRTERRDLTFVFVGRINKVKGLERALLIISELKKTNTNPIFDIYGPDEGEKNKLELLVSKYDLSKNVNFKGVIAQDKVPECLLNYTFYMQTSYREGMGASIVLSQMIGLIPVVTPVGEISRYCNDDNSVIVDDFKPCSIKKTVKEILNILNNDERFFNLKDNAENSLKNYRFFDDAISDVFNSLEMIFK